MASSPGLCNATMSSLRLFQIAEEHEILRYMISLPTRERGRRQEGDGRERDLADDGVQYGDP